MMQFVLSFLIAAAIAGAGHAAPVRAAATQTGGQSPPKILRRTFHPGDLWRYRVRLTLRSELEDLERAEPSASAKNVQQSAEVKLDWIVTERVVSVTPDGAARIQEQLEKFGTIEHSQESEAEDAEAVKPAATLDRTVTDWAHSHTFEFQVKPNGLTSEIPAEGAPKLEESGRPLLTLWMNHALRPQATLPARPVRPGESWQEPRRVHIAEWTTVQASEKDEWLDAPDREHAAVRLHVVQEISGRVLENRAGTSARAGEKEEGETPSRGGSKTEAFIGESLSTLALDDGRVLAATRSARRESSQELPPAAGTTQPRRSRAILSVKVEIEPCVEKECEAGSNR